MADRLPGPNEAARVRVLLFALASACTFAPPGGSPASGPGPGETGEEGGDDGSAGTSAGESGAVSSGPVSTASSTDPIPETTGERPPEGWWSIDWPFRQRIELSPPAGSALPDFPLVVTIDLASGDYDAIARDAADVRFVDDDGHTVLAHEIEADVQGVAGVFWVRLAQLDPGRDGLWMYWGNGAADPDEQPSTVWSEQYAAVWHMNVDPEGAAPQVRDSVGGHHGTLAGGLLPEAATEGRVGPGLSFDGVDDFADMGDLGSDGWTGITLEAWILPLGTSERVLCKSTGVPVDEHTWCLAIPSGNLQARLHTGGAGGSVQTHDQLADIEPQTWTHIAWTWAQGDGNVRAYVDGHEVMAAPHGGESIANSSQLVAIANVNATDDRFTHGVFDEVRVSSVARRPAWMRAQFLAMTGELLSLGPVEALP